MGSTFDMYVRGKGQEVVATVADICIGCEVSHIDFSIAAWNKLTEWSDPSVITVE